MADLKRRVGLKLCITAFICVIMCASLYMPYTSALSIKWWGFAKSIKKSLESRQIEEKLTEEQPVVHAGVSGNVENGQPATKDVENGENKQGSINIISDVQNKNDLNIKTIIDKSTNEIHKTADKSATSQKLDKMNVLFIISDDMRPELGFYEDTTPPSPVFPKMHTPNLDSLARRSTVFHKAYVQYPLCGPSRASFLTSRRPDTLRQYSFDSFRATAGKHIISLPQYFMQNGYKSIGIGKIFDPPRDGKNRIIEEDYSFSEPWFEGSNYHYWTHEVLDKSWHAVEPRREQWRPLPDNQVLNHALQRLKSLRGESQSSDQPFFMAVGFYKPHCPYIFPEKYIDYYPENQIKLPENPHVPTNFPQEAWHDYRNLRRFADTGKFAATYNTTLPDSLTLELRRAYYSAVTYIDDLIGQLLTELDNQGFHDNTIVCFLGDHGYHLGENGEWTKQTSLELSARAPLMVYIPGVTPQGSQKHEFVEFVDIFPTIVEAAGLPPLSRCPETNSSGIDICTEGISFLPVILNQGPELAWKNATFTMQSRFRYNVMAHSMRTSKYRYTEWRRMDTKQKIVATELYDHDEDPQENFNISEDPVMKSIKKTLHSQLDAYWRSSLPSLQAALS